MPKSNRLALLLAFGLGCGGAPAEPPPAGGTLEILVPARELRPGRTMQAEVRLRSAEGEVVEPPTVTWRSLTPGTVQVDTSGRLLAIAPGVGVVRASAGALAAELTLTLRNPPVRTLTLDADSLRLSLPNGTRSLAAIARDSIGDPILGVALQWSSSAARIAAVTTLGQVTAVAAGRTRVVAQADAATAAVEVTVVADPSPTAPVIAGIAPLVVVPGQTLVVNGSLFGATVGANSVVLDGVPLTVTQATSSQLVLAVPPATSFPCTPRRTVALQVGTAGGIGVASVPLEVASARTLARGSYLLLTAAQAYCLDLSGAPGRYQLAATNVARTIGAPSLSASVTGVTSAAGLALDAAMTSTPRASAIATTTTTASSDAAAGMHVALLEANRQAVPIARLVGTPEPTPAVRRADLPRLVEPRVGDLRQIRLPALGQPDLCTRFTPLTARVAWVGRRIAILEDTTTVLDGVRTLAGTQDALYATVGAELDSLGWAITRLFGDPLVMDSRLDDDGHVAVIVTPRMNAVLGGAALAATVTCDLFPRAQFAASNVGEVVYAQAPTRDAIGDAFGTPTRWRREMRATLVHELKHVAAYAERVVRGQPLEESWLEEGTARHAEEQFARAIYRYARNANVGFAESLACEIAATGCADVPRAMQPHLEALYEMLAASTARSPLGPTSVGDLTFYGSAWAFTRWALDQQGSEEPATFSAFTTSGQSGLANLEARVQRPWEELLPEWALTMMVDDAGFAVPARLTFPSWQLRSQFRGLCETLGRCRSSSGDLRFRDADPVRALRVEPAAVAVTTSEAPPSLALGAIVPGGFAPIDLRIAAGANAVIGFTATGGAPATFRVAVLRVE